MRFFVIFVVLCVGLAACKDLSPVASPDEAVVPKSAKSAKKVADKVVVAVALDEVDDDDEESLKSDAAAAPDSPAVDPEEDENEDAVAKAESEDEPEAEQKAPDASNKKRKAASAKSPVVEASPDAAEVDSDAEVAAKKKRSPEARDAALKRFKRGLGLSVNNYNSDEYDTTSKLINYLSNLAYQVQYCDQNNYGCGYYGCGYYGGYCPYYGPYYGGAAPYSAAAGAAPDSAAPGAVPFSAAVGAPGAEAAPGGVVADAPKFAGAKNVGDGAGPQNALPGPWFGADPSLPKAFAPQGPWAQNPDPRAFNPGQQRGFPPNAFFPFADGRSLPLPGQGPKPAEAVTTAAPEKEASGNAAPAPVKPAV